MGLFPLFCHHIAHTSVNSLSLPFYSLNSIPLSGCPTCPPDLEQRLESPITLILPENGISIDELCSILTDTADQEIVVYDGGDLRTAQWFEHAPLRVILDSVTEEHGLRWEVDEEIVLIRSSE